MKSKNEMWATIGLIFITFLAAIQYLFLKNVPETVSSFAFVCITNVIGLVLLGIARPKKLLSLKKKSFLKGVVLALELTGFNVFMLIGSRHLDVVIISSLVSMYFVFITPILLLLKKKVNFFSGIATVIAIISLLMMFGADTSTLFASKDVVYLIISDLFFAAYVVSVSIFGEGEDPMELTLSQMICASVFAFIGWLAECVVSGNGLSVPTQGSFWISAVFIGLFIRAAYGLIQITSQKYVSALKASLIFSAEIIITFITSPIISRLFNMEYTIPSWYQIVGAILLIIATLLVDEGFVAKLGYADVEATTVIDEAGNEIKRSSVARKIILTTLTFAMLTLIFSTILFLAAINYVKNTTVTNSKELGENASTISSDAMVEKLKEGLKMQVTDKSYLAQQKLSAYTDAITYAASYAEALLENPGIYPDKEVEQPDSKNAGKWVMMRNLANTSIKYESVRDKSKLLGNMVDMFEPIVKNNSNIATIYIGTEDGLLISYDPFSDTGGAVGEGYFEYRERPWYIMSKTLDGYAFTDTYQDDYGRGLTITCVAPFKDPQGNFAGCIGMDILMSELNRAMVNDGIVDPCYATMIDYEGNCIAGKNVDPLAEDMGTIFDQGRDEVLRRVGEEILTNKNGIAKVGEDENANFVAYSSIDSTNWILCIASPVSEIIKPALEIRDNIDQNTDTMVGTVMEGIMAVIQTCLLLSALILLFVTFFAGNVSRKISDPLKQLEGDVKSISGGHLEKRTSVSTDDEIGSLANSFNQMTDSLQRYILSLKEMTAREERIGTELAFAKSIQASMLPTEFSTYSELGAFSLYASMNPAKEVGGDFYDFFMTDDTHLALLIADVSGKGIPASLFMARAMTSLKMRSMLGGSPAEIMTDVNVQMCEGNEEELFVTVWLAIIDITTGKGLAANAGHEHPALRRAGEKYELVMYKHSTMVATFEGAKFKEHEFELHPGDTLFVYTDGVPEATTVEDNVFFGYDGLLEALNKDPEAKPENILSNVSKAIKEFSAGAEQFDDITMLCLHYNGNIEKKEA